MAGMLLLLVLGIRATSGIDLTDEMQYYGQIKGLIESRGLFSNDLFLQQTAYVPMYPVFALYHWAFGYDGFVFFGRLLLAGLVVLLFFYAVGVLVRHGCSKGQASFAALAMTFAIPYHGIFALSYNTLSQVLWAVFALQVVAWERRNCIVLGLLTGAMAIFHPLSAIAVFLAVMLRLVIEADYTAIRRFLKWLLLASAALAGVLLLLASPEQYLNSVRFSGGYGVGAALLSNKPQLLALGASYVLFGASFLLGTRFSATRFKWTLLLGLIGATAYFYTGQAESSYSTRTVYVLGALALLAHGLALSRNHADAEARRTANWLVVVLLLFGTTLAFSSSNGLGQATGALMVVLPLLVVCALMPSSNDARRAGMVEGWRYGVTAMLLALFVVHWSLYPYREARWWQAQVPIDAIPEFRFIHTNDERAAVIAEVRQVLGPDVQKKKALIVSEFPGLYFILDAAAETCMLYMHSVPSRQTARVLFECLGRKSPEVVMVFPPDQARIGAAIKHLYGSRAALSCVVRPVAGDLQNMSPEICS